jgi:hypothetical protein
MCVVLIPLPTEYTDGALTAWVSGVVDALYPLPAKEQTPAD